MLPRLSERLLALVIADTQWRAAILGDLAEEFALMSRAHGPRYARLWHWRQTLGIAAHQLRARMWRRASSPSMLEQPQPRAGMTGLLWHDLRFAWRSVAHQPALAATIVLVLGVALAANATIFAIADALVLRPFRYPGVGQAVVVASTPYERFFDRESVAAGDFLDWSDQARDVFGLLAAIQWWDPNYTHSGSPQPLAGFRVSPELFEILGEQPLLGRWLRPADTLSASTVVIGEAFWRRQFGGRSDVLGATLRLDGVAHQVVGVMPDRFRAPFGADVWAPLHLPPSAQADRNRGNLIIVGRLAPGATLQHADARLQAILAGQRRAFPETHARRQVSVRSFTEGFGDPGAGPFVAVWQLAAALLLLVACANVANLVLARNAEREREFAIRLALGAGSGRIAWQLLLEGLLLAGGAAIIALPLTSAGLQATRAALPPAIIRFVGGFDYLQLEPLTFLATAALAGVATILFAMAPALRAGRQSTVSGLRQGGRLTAGPGRQRGRAVLATAQIALTLALLASAGLSLSALYRVTEGSLGFDQHGVLAGRLSLPRARYDDDARRQQFMERVLARLTALSPVTDAAAISHLPYGGSNSSTPLWPEGVATRDADAVSVDWRGTSPTALSLLRVSLIRGRMLAPSDRSEVPPVAVVNQLLARRVWPSREALGQRFRLRADGPLITVVGVVDDVTHDWLFGTRPTVYRPFAQEPPASFAFLLRTPGDPVQLSADLRAAVLAEDPEQPLLDVRPMTQVVEDGTSGLRVAGRALGVIALVSCLLSTIGLYSLMSFLTSRRTREIGVRVALGATRCDVIRLTVATALRLTLAGIAFGLVLAFLAAGLLEQAMFGVVTGSLPLAVGLAVLLGVVSTAAGLIPARRATMVNPTVALRAE